MKKLLVGNRNRLTKRKAPNCTLDLVYEICKLVMNGCNKQFLINSTNTNRQSFNDCLGLCIDNGFIKLVDPPINTRSRYYYSLTDEGRNNIRIYDMMNSSIQRADMNIKVDNRPY